MLGAGRLRTSECVVEAKKMCAEDLAGLSAAKGVDETGARTLHLLICTVQKVDSEGPGPSWREALRL